MHKYSVPLVVITYYLGNFRVFFFIFPSLSLSWGSAVLGWREKIRCRSWSCSSGSRCCLVWPSALSHHRELPPNSLESGAGKMWGNSGVLVQGIWWQLRKASDPNKMGPEMSEESHRDNYRGRGDNKQNSVRQNLSEGARKPHFKWK